MKASCVASRASPRSPGQSISHLNIPSFMPAHELGECSLVPIHEPPYEVFVRGVAVLLIETVHRVGHRSARGTEELDLVYEGGPGPPAG